MDKQRLRSIETKLNNLSEGPLLIFVEYLKYLKYEVVQNSLKSNSLGEIQNRNGKVEILDEILYTLKKLSKIV